MIRKALLSISLVLAISTTCLAQVKLERKVPEGASWTTQARTKLEQKLTIAGMEVDTGSETRTEQTSTAGKRDSEGKLRVREKIKSLVITSSVMGQVYNFDSANPDNKGTSALEITRPIHKALLENTTTMVYDKNNQVVAVEMDQNLVNTLPQEAQALAKGQLDPEHLKREANEQLDQFPSDPVKKGDTWKRTRNVSFGAGQVMTFESEFTYNGTVEKDGKTLDKIDSKTLTADFFLQDSPLPFTVKDSALKVPESSGTILFDRKLGQVVEAKSSSRITGDMTFVINGMDLPVKLDLKIENESSLTDAK